MPQQRMPRSEVAILVGIAVYAFVIFLPWTHDVMVANVSLFAWLMFALMVLAPATGLVVALKSDVED
ncbi:MAG: hypothetical protein H7288_09770 [Kineosporiaceae bacterium]|nr:hypothetical protein [Aeromicrobium sp.]